MMRNLFLLSLVFLTSAGRLISQTAPIDGQMIKQTPAPPITPTTITEITPGGFFDNLYDNFGNVYSYNDLNIKLNPGDPGPEIQSVMTCTAGYFRAFFANGSGFELNNPIHNARRAVVCEVLHNLSGFVNQSFAVAGSTVYVNILFDNMANFYPTPGNPGAPLGGCSPIYCMPNGPSSPNPGIIDNLVYKTIITEQDGYTNVGAPLLTPGGGGGFYHALAAFNFVNPNYTWHTNMAVLPAPTDRDLYSTILHEMTHALGFGTLISSTGVSFFGASNNYYTRYDTHLRTSGGSPLLSATGACVPAYGLAFTAPVSVLGPGACPSSPPLTTNCNTAIKYVSPLLPNMPVYNPSCFESGSTLSHFEDMCYPSPNPANDDQYFVMSNGGPPGLAKRYLKEEERSVLCDLGYTTSNSYTSTALAAPNNYTAATCTPPNIWGVNDGLSGGAYTYTSNGGPVNIAISGGTASILFNDSPTAVNAICIESVYFNGLVSVAGNIITFVPNPGYSGAFCLRYIPVDNLGNQGNITYIIGFIYSASCNISPLCDLVPNGTFEATQGGCGTLSPLTHPDCWFNNTGSPDFFVRNCNNGLTYNLGTNTYFTSPVVNNHPGPPSPNNAVVGIGAFVSTTMTPANNITESIWGRLTTPLVPGQAYTLNFWLYQHQGLLKTAPPLSFQYTCNPNAVPLVLTAASRFSPPNCPGCLYPEPGATPLISLTVPNVFNTWVPYSLTFTYTNGTPNQFFEIGANDLLTLNNVTNTPGVNLTKPYTHFVFIDDVSLKVAGSVSTFTPPSPICFGGSLSDLSQFVNPFIPNAVFTGTGVVNNGGVYSFNAAPNNTLSPGIYPVTMSYTNNLGCTIYVNAAITITTVPPPFNFTLNPAYCQNTGISNLSVCITPTNYANCGTFTGPGVYNFPNPPFCPLSYGLAFPNVPGGLGINSFTYTYPNLVLTNTAVPGGTLSCTAFATATTNVIPAITLTAAVNPTNNCVQVGQSATLTALSNFSTATCTWVPGNLTGSLVVVSPTANTVYTVTANNGFCSTSGTVIVNVAPAPQFSNTPLFLCTGQSVFYLENWLAPSTPTGGIWTAPFITSPTGTPGLTAGYLNPTITPVGTQTISYTYSTIAGCFATNQFTVNIVPGFLLNTNGMSTFCKNLGIGALLDATATPSANVTYTWNPGNLIGATQTVFPLSPTVYTLVATNTVTGCQFDATTFVDVRNDCCTGVNYLMTNNVGSPGALTTYTGSWAVNQNISINGTVSLSGEFVMAQNVTITINPGAKLDLGSTHLYSCQKMWSGIVVQNGGRVRVSKESLIEDAVIGILSDGSTNTNTNPQNFDIDIDDITFNRCFYGIAIRNYNQPVNVPPFRIVGCLFTSRNIPYTTGNNASWPPTNPGVGGMISGTGCSSVNPLASPYCVNNISGPVNLKQPYQSFPAFAGVYIENSGITLGAGGPTPTYYSIKVGDNVPNVQYNLFDYLMHGIYSKNSNVASYVNIFQNTRMKGSAGGIGIYAFNDNTSPANANNHLTTYDPANPTTNINRFYDCDKGIAATNIFELNVLYSDFRSTQSNFNPNGPSGVPGYYGITCVGNRMRNYLIINNKFQNLNTCVAFNLAPGPLNIPPYPSYGQYLGGINVQNNFFSPTTTTNTPITNQFVNYGVYAASSLNGGNFTFLEPNAELRVQLNTFSRVFRGIYAGGFNLPKFSFFSVNNNITMVPDGNLPPSSATSPQFGINHSLDIASVANKNNISGTPAMQNSTLTAGIVYNANQSSAVFCNSVSTIGNCFEFYTPNPGTIWLGNQMQSAKRGLFLRINGVIGQQGSPSNAFDNEWLGNWTGTNYSTWTQTTTASSSPLYVRNLAPFIPINNLGNPVPTSYLGIPGAINTSPVTGLGNFYCGIPNPPPGGGCPTCRMATLDSLAVDGIPFGVLTSETQEISKHNLFRSLMEDSLLAFSTNTLQTFFTSNVNNNTSRNKLYNIERQIGSGNFAQASSMLNSFSPSTNVESNYQLFYTLSKTYFATGSLSVQENQQLKKLAEKCPAIDGTVVYQARHLYGLVNDIVITYNDYFCVNGNDQILGRTFGNESKNSGSAKNLDSDFWFVDIFPNPAKDELTISSSNESDNVTMNVYDPQGKLLFNSKVKISSYSERVKLDLINGIYFVYLSNGQGERVVKKLVISK